MSRAVRRRYLSAVRTEQARLTRDRVVAAARALFVERGYAATSVAAVAAAAGVAAETVYSTFGTKRRLLEEVVASGIEEDREAPGDLLDRAWVRSLLAVPGVEARLREWTRRTADAVERVSPLHAVVRAAAASDPGLADVYASVQEHRFAEQRHVLEAVAAGVARLDVDAAAGTFSALTSPELHHLLRRTRGWSEARYQRWLETTVVSAVLTPANARG